MKVGLIDDEIIVMEPGDRYKALAQYMCWDKRTKSLRARATLERLNGLAGIFTLPRALSALRERLQRKQAMIEKLRADENPRPLMDFPIKPGIKLFAHQIRAVNMCLTEFGQDEHKGFGLLFEMGLGKSLTAVTIMGCLHEMRRIKRVLVVAPTSVVAVWPKELHAFASFPWRAKALVGDKKHRPEAR